MRSLDRKVELTSGFLIHRYEFAYWFMFGYGLVFLLYWLVSGLPMMVFLIMYLYLTVRKTLDPWQIHFVVCTL